MHYIKKT